ncbi:MAG: DODA-type extradiol aromatic ring-opening family dioxygenase [Caulobacteraceae bacterium]
MRSTRLPTYYLSHGGGPWPWMKDQAGATFDKLEAGLLEVRAELADVPKAVLVISGHWETAQFEVSSATHPGMEFDYYGFPEHLYRITYPAPGAPALAERVAALLAAGGHPCKADPERGFDHGTFSLMKPLYPDAEMPIVQLSLRADLDPREHLDVGALLAPLRDEGVLIIGSGSSYHNLRLRGAQAVAPGRAFDDWLNQTLVESAFAERKARLLQWDRAPAARMVHPREDHLLPLMVAVGAAAGEPGVRVYHEADFMGGWVLSSWRFGSAPSMQGRDATPSG